MIYKIVGSILIIFGCGGFGFIIAHNAKKEIYTLRQFIIALEFMECELKYRLTPLPQLCVLATTVTNGIIRKFFMELNEQLKLQLSSNVEQCVKNAMRNCSEIPPITAKQINEFARSLGAFDLNGQIQCIKSSNDENIRLLNTIRTNHQERIRSYQTLSLCAGAALVILFI